VHLELGKRSSRSQDNATDACQELAGCDRLDEVVVSPEKKASDAVKVVRLHA
jgi:hypothetical protein